MVAPLLVDGKRPLLALLVDRDADTREMYAEYLRHFSCDVDEAPDGREALAKVMSRRPDIVVTETRLPGISGLDLCRLLRSESQTRDIPIVVVTGDGFEPDIARARDAGADSVLIKPCAPEQLVAEIRRLLERPRRLRSGRRAPSKAKHERSNTTTPPQKPPSLLCPQCGGLLRYLNSQVADASAPHPEQWDYFECAAGCGVFQYRQRTGRMRLVS